MLNHTHVIETFPSVRIMSEAGGLPVEVSLIAQLGHGSGNHLYASVLLRQQKHLSFVDELDEPSAKLGGTDFSKGDPSSLYTFAVGPQGHPFHRHAGHRIFTAVSGSGGAQLRFSTASPEQVAEDPQNFIRALRYVNIPPDCMFTVRFGGETWHQFAPLSRQALHPAFFALSCHTNELGGHLSDALKEKIVANEATIPALTEVLPPEVLSLLQDETFNPLAVPTTTLSLDAPEGTFHRVICNAVRSAAGTLRGAWGARVKASGFLSYAEFGGEVIALNAPPADSLLRQHLTQVPLHHEDTFSLIVHGIEIQHRSASQLLAAVLEGFLLNPPSNVTRLMAFRNVLVKPLGLRTSPLGCPVSSLLCENAANVFASQYPVLDQAMNADDTQAQVILGADDKHLLFRACVGVKLIDAQRIEISLGNRVHCKNWFGRFYMSAIDFVHRHYIVPTMLKQAAAYALNKKARK